MNLKELSLLLFLESAAVEHGGLIRSIHMNDEDMAIAKRWHAEGFIEFSRLQAKSIKSLGGSFTHAVFLTDEAFAAAHAERKDRAARIINSRRWVTTLEKRKATPAA